MEYFILPINWTGSLIFLIYFQNDDDGVFTLPDRKFLLSSSRNEMVVLAKKFRLKLQKQDLDLLDLSQIQAWVNSRSTRLPKINLVYRAWNFLGDVASTLKLASHYLGYSPDFIALHDELFWGCNLPGLTQADQRYEVDLSKSEIRNLRSILRSGLEIFQQGIDKS